ncbi:hypothetical protein JTE90_024089 [Oedothorax gibbosus]|uniref:Uncharacterized protein n=1 Tax=Oedothorax gibbosus TaxID=931172 RepID=A0AAV6USN6_9ARAC|nr:hypothetical protein JTE90_024089 [Oedothorax gibbosus]
MNRSAAVDVVNCLISCISFKSNERYLPFAASGDPKQRRWGRLSNHREKERFRRGAFRKVKAKVSAQEVWASLEGRSPSSPAAHLQKAKDPSRPKRRGVIN